MKRDDGIALVSTLLLLALLGAIAVPLTVLSRLQVRIGAYEARRQQALSLARSALQAVAIDLPPSGAHTYPTTEDGEPTDAWLVSSENLLPANVGGFQVRVTDEAGKLPVGRATTSMLAALPGMDSASAAAIVDWVTPESQITGESSAEYEGAVYKPRHGTPTTIAELALAAGLTPDLIWGSDANGNGQRDRGEAVDAQGNLQPGLIDWLTSQTATTPNGLLDINTATANQIVSASQNRITANQAQALVTYRQSRGRLTSFSQVAAAPGFGWQSLRYIVDRVRPPVASGNDVTRVNINTAPAAVLAVLPGMTEELLADLLAKRQAEPLQNLASLWDLGSFSSSNAGLLDWVTLQAGPWRLQIVAWPAAGKPMVQAEAYVARQGNAMRVLYWRLI